MINLIVKIIVPIFKWFLKKEADKAALEKRLHEYANRWDSRKVKLSSTLKKQWDKLKKMKKNEKK